MRSEILTCQPQTVLLTLERRPIRKGGLFTTGKVIQRLFIIGLYTQLAIYGYR